MVGKKFRDLNGMLSAGINTMVQFFETGSNWEERGQFIEICIINSKVASVLSLVIYISM